MSVVRGNIAANTAGTAVGLVVLLGAVPVYLNALGAEAYGLVGLFSTLTAASVSLDFGLSFTINREMARLSVGARDPDDAHAIATLHAACWLVGAAIGAVVIVAAPYVATSWLSFWRLSVGEVTRSLRLMGAAVVLIVARNFYVAALNGLQRQGLANLCQAGGLAARALCTILALRYLGARPLVFFGMQLALLVAETAAAAVTLRRVMPGAGRGGRVRVAAVRQRVGFSAGVTATMVLALALTYMDQAILSRVLPLSEFGYYTLACALAGALGYAVHPVTTALYPRFSQLVEQRDTAAVSEAYHLFSQVVAVLVLPVGLVIACFPREVLELWTHNAEASRGAAAVLSLRSLGTSINALMHVPHVLQLAFGWSSLGAAANAVALIVVTPATIVLAVHYGGVGVAAVWVGLNVGYIVFAIGRMHRRVLVGERARWYAGTLVPGAAVAAVVVTSRLTMPEALPPAATTAWLALTCAVATAAALASAPAARTPWHRAAVRWRSR